MSLIRFLLAALLAAPLSAAEGTLEAPAASSAPASAAHAVQPDVPLPKSKAVPSADGGLIGRLVAAMLEQGHYAGRPIDMSLSGRALRNYFDELDYGHFFFEQADIDRFQRMYGDAFMDRLRRDADVSPAFEIFDTFLERVQTRVEALKELTSKDLDFTADEAVLLDRHKAGWAASSAEAADLWRRQVKAEILQERLNKAKADEPVKTVRRRYDRLHRSVLEYDGNDVLELYLTALAHAFDPHSDYLAAPQKANLDISLKLSLVGIGALLRSEDGYVSIVSLVPGGPADIDKRLKPSDKIEAVSQGGEGAWEDVVGMKLDRVVSLIRGEKGTKVRLKVIPADAISPSTRVVIDLVRDEIHLTEQEAKGRIIDLPAGGGKTAKLGVIEIPSFYSGEGKSTTRDVQTLVGRLRDKGAEGILVDLRRNPGGVLGEAVSLSGFFIGAGPVVQVKDPDGGAKTLRASSNGERYDGPLVVLVSRMSASASKIFAGAMQDYGRAVIVGDKSTFGKGTVQSVIDLASTLPPAYHGPNPGALKLTIQKFYRVSGASTQNRGVQPDIRLPSVTDVLDTSESSLDYALPYDETAPAAYTRKDWVSDVLPALQAASAARVSSSHEFGYVRQDIDFVAKQKAEKTVSLNEKKRLAEIEERNARDEQRKKERSARKAPELKATVVTLSGAEPPPPPAVAASTGPAAGYDKAPPAPDAGYEEALRVLADLVSPAVRQGATR